MPSAFDRPAAKLSVKVLYEDNHCIAVFKPHGMLTQQDKSSDPSLMDQVKGFIKARDKKPGNVFLGLVHRLDRPVGGVVLFAKTSKGASRLSGQFREHIVQKIYWAVVEGRPKLEEGGVVQYLVKDRVKNIVKAHKNPVPGAQRAELSYHCLKSVKGFTLIEIISKTGRPHQIRVAMASLGTPIAGDKKYGSDQGLDGAIALFARVLSFEQPVTHDPITVTADLELQLFKQFLVPGKI